MPAADPTSTGTVDPAAPPRVAIRVGISGHRKLEEASVPAIRGAVERILAAVASHAEAIRSAAGSGFGPRPPLLRAVSPLAEGADRIFAHAALARGWDLQCPLPFERGEYEKDFPSEGSRSEFRTMLARASAVLECDGAREQADAAYAEVGSVLLNQVDVLVAVWNGKPAQGPGGTAEVVADARRQRVPVVWVSSLDGAVVAIDADSGRASSVPWEDALRRSMNRALVLGGGEPGVLPSPELRAERERFEDAIRVARDRGSALGWFFLTFMRVLSWPPAPSIAPDAEIDARAVLPTPFVPHYERANQAAIRYAGIDRGGVLANYFLGVVAVLCALLGILLPPQVEPLPGWLQTGLIAAELISLAGMAALYAYARATKSKLRALDCRLYAEQLRQMEFLWPLGRTAPEAQPMAHERFGDPRTTAMAWRFRALVREVGMPGGVMDRGMLGTALGSIRDLWIGGRGGQLAYHAVNARRIERVDHRLHAFAWTLFVATFLCCLGHLLVHGSPRLALWLTVACAALPAVGAAAHAVTSQFEFRRLRERSECMQQILAEALAALRAVDSDRRRVTSRAIAEAVQPASRAMMDEVMGWRILASKPPTEPA